MGKNFYCQSFMSQNKEERSPEFSGPDFVAALFSDSGWPFQEEVLEGELREGARSVGPGPKKDPVKEKAIQEAPTILGAPAPKQSRVESTAVKVHQDNLPKVGELANATFDIVEERLRNYLDQLGPCRKCDLHLSADSQVIHDCARFLGKKGPISVMFVGDRPKGKLQEDTDVSLDAQSGHGQIIRRLLSDEEGELFEKMVKAMGLSQESYHLTMLAKCAPSEPQQVKQLIEECQSHLLQEVFLFKPRVIVTMGALATQALLNTKQRLSEVHGQFITHSFLLGPETFECPIVPIFHPEFLLINPNMKKTTWLDLQKIMAFLA